ncbi:MAG: transcription termination/antitermination protein NusA [Clostridia bacterium]|nr:transcription termination/antitermination protein NusA [Clostridia bacterium]
MNSEFFEAVKLLEKEKGVPANLLCERIQQALIVALRNDYNKKEVVFCEIDPQTETMRVWLRKNVVETVEDPDMEITVDEAKKYQSNAIVGDIIEIEMQSREFSRVAAQTAKHVIRQGIREAERGQIMEEFQKRYQELVTAKVYSVDPETGNAVVEIGKSEALLPKGEQVPGEVLREGELTKVFIVDVRVSERGGPKVMISRTHPGLVRRLFEAEVPEIYDGIVEIKSVSREAGSRTKIAVYSADENVDPVGACIGPRGMRVEKIVDSLNGEKIDIIKYSDDPKEFISAALAPSDVIRVDIDDENVKSCHVIVPDSQLSLAIGNKGQNARLAAKLTGWKIDICAESGVGREENETEE